MSVKIINKDLVQAALDSNDSILGELAFHENYSGRFMYGKECFGISGELPDLVKFIAAYTGQAAYEAAANVAEGEYAEDAVDDAVSKAIVMFGSARFDSMGLGSIIYFPGYSLE